MRKVETSIHTPSPAHPFPSLGFGLLAVVLSLLGGLLLYSDDANRMNGTLLFFLGRLRVLLLCGIVPAWGLLLGYSVLRPLEKIRGRDASPSLALSLVLGLGLLSHLVWLLGAVGEALMIHAFRPAVVWALLLASFLLLRKNARLAAGDVWRRFVPVLPARRELPQGFGVVVALGCALLGFVLPRLVLTAFAPSFLYDVLEYHLPFARSLLRTGSIAPLPLNAYTQMPQGIESLFALGALFEGRLDGFAPKLVNLGLGLCGLLTLDLILREMGARPRTRLLGALLFLLHPIHFKSLADAYVDMGTALFVSAGLLCWLRSARAPNRLDPLLGAAFMGFALGCKYPAMGVAVLPYLFLLLPLGAMTDFKKPRFANLRATPRLVLLGCLVVFLVHSPWILRGFAYGRSPFPPLTAPWCGDRSITPIRECMKWHHHPVSPLRAAYWETLSRRLPSKTGAPLLLAALVYLLYPGVGKRRRGLALFAVAGGLFWSSAPNAEDRFLAPLLPAFIALGLLLPSDLSRVWPRVGRLAWAPLLLWVGALVFTQDLAARQQGLYRAGLGLLDRSEFWSLQWGESTATLFDKLNHASSEWEQRNGSPAKVMMLYEARAAALDPEVDVRFNTVFDYDVFYQWMYGKNGVVEAARKVQSEPLTDSQILAALQIDKFSHLVVNEVELARLLGTYPAVEAFDDSEYQRVRRMPKPGSFNPAFLALRRFYPPVYYAAGETVARGHFERLDAFLEFLLKECPVVWKTEIAGCRMLIVEIPR